MTETVVRGTTAIPEPGQAHPPTPLAEVDRAVTEVVAQEQTWVETSVRDRIALIERLTADTLTQSERWVREACRAKRIPFDGPLAGEEWIGGPVAVLRMLRLLRGSLVQIQESGRPQFPGKVRTRPGGQVTVGVFPYDTYDRLLYTGFSAEVWMEPGVTPPEVEARQAATYRPGADRPGGTALVLGAGNVSAIAPTDAFTMLFNDDRVVVLKMNPVNDYLGPVFADAFQALIDPGFLRIVYGGAEVGAHLVRHPDVDTVHVTGSDKTYDAIVYGGGEQGHARKVADEPEVTKPVTAELGNVTPVIVVPGPWSDKDLAFQGVNLASMLVNNGGFNCIASRVMVTHEGWNQREPLLGAIRDGLRAAPQRFPYYPGAEDRFHGYVGAHPEAETFGEGGEGGVPWTLIPGLDRTAADDICFTTEAFCGVVGEVALGGESVAAYVDEAVRFCNDRLWGTLAATIIVHPKSLQEPAVRAAVERAVADLRYGTVSVNHWSAVGFVFGTTTWGAFPGHTRTDIQSGMGIVHNTLMLDGVQKTVVRGPFRTPTKPAWFLTHRTVHQLGPKLAALEAAPSPAKLPGIFATALRG